MTPAAPSARTQAQGTAIKKSDNDTDSAVGDDLAHGPVVADDKELAIPAADAADWREAAEVARGAHGGEEAVRDARGWNLDPLSKPGNIVVCRVSSQTKHNRKHKHSRGGNCVVRFAFNMRAICDACDHSLRPSYGQRRQCPWEHHIYPEGHQERPAHGHVCLLSEAPVQEVDLQHAEPLPIWCREVASCFFAVGQQANPSRQISRMRAGTIGPMARLANNPV